MAIYFHIPPEGGWEEHTSYVVEVSEQQGNPVFGAILEVGFLNKGDLLFWQPLAIKGSIYSISDFQYIKAIRKIDMSIPNRGKQINELNLFELKQHMKEVNNEIEFAPFYSTSN